MYGSFSEIEEYLNNNPDKPFILCEYCHAMGNGPGDFEDYFELIEANEHFCGAFVWEWCDHAIYKGQHENGKDIYYYGGDHGEIPHDENFCMDGLVYPNRRPHTGLLEYKNVNRPTRAMAFEQETGKLTLHSYMDFVDLKDYLYVTWELDCDGEITAKGRIADESMVSVKPHQEGQVLLDVSVPDKGKCYLKVYYYLKHASELLKEGHLLGFDEIRLENNDGTNQTKKTLVGMKKEGNITITEDDRYLTVSGQQFTYVYNKLTGMFDSMVYQGRKLLEKPMEVNIWRAPIDNDRSIKIQWKQLRYDMAKSRTYESSYEITEGGIKIYSSMSVVAVAVQKILDIKAEWFITNAGVIHMDMDVDRNEEYSMLPRFGVRIFLPKDMEKVTYYGMGPQESYRDKHRATTHGKFSCLVSDMHEDYLRPQENGSHYDCDYVIVKGEEDRLTVVSDDAFSFNASVYTQEELTEKRHNYELNPSGCTVLCIDYAQNGIGSNSCGQPLLEKYRLDDAKFHFGITISYDRGDKEL